MAAARNLGSTGRAISIIRWVGSGSAELAGHAAGLKEKLVGEEMGSECWRRWLDWSVVVNSKGQGCCRWV